MSLLIVNFPSLFRNKHTQKCRRSIPMFIWYILNALCSKEVSLCSYGQLYKLGCAYIWKGRNENAVCTWSSFVGSCVYVVNFFPRHRTSNLWLCCAQIIWEMQAVLVRLEWLVSQQAVEMLCYRTSLSVKENFLIIMSMGSYMFIMHVSQF